MSRTSVARTTTRSALGPISVGLFVVTTAIIATLVYQSAAPSSAPASSEVHRDDHGATTTEADGSATEDDGSVTQDDGVLPDGVTVFDDQYPAVTNLNAHLLGALRAAATEAAGDGVEFIVTSGWRTPAYQNQLLREAVSKYGSEEEAARWVATADTSPHVSGDAIDIGHVDATAWLFEHGAAYGLCQIYRNEPWHYELRPEAIDHGCPARYADPTHDPRMHRDGPPPPVPSRHR